MQLERAVLKYVIISFRMLHILHIFNVVCRLFPNTLWNNLYNRINIFLYEVFFSTVIFTLLNIPFKVTYNYLLSSFFCKLCIDIVKKMQDLIRYACRGVIVLPASVRSFRVCRHFWPVQTQMEMERLVFRRKQYFDKEIRKKCDSSV